MFRSAKTMFFILGGLLIGITLFTGFLFVDPVGRTRAFWYTISGIMLSEVFMTLSVMDLGGNHGDRALPYRFCNGLIGILYFVFTMVMLIVFCCDAAAETILIMQIIGLFAALVFYVLFGLAAKATSDDASRFQAERISKKRFNVELQSLKIDMAPLFQTDPRLNRQFLLLADLARFAPESIEGTEPIDREIFDGIAKLREAVEGEAPEKAEAAADHLISLFQKRQILVRESR